MKNTLVTFVITGVIAMVSLSATAQEDKKAAAARKKVAAAKLDLKEAKIDSAIDFQKFKKESEVKIKDNQSKIAILKAKKSNESRDIRKKYDEKVFALESKNNELKKKMKNAGETKTDAWVNFKHAFNRDMQELEAAIKSI